jgi:cytochrome c oxidase subunit II
MSSNQHITTRRGFIATLGFGGVSLYGLWAAYGAAPTPLALFSSESAAEEAGGHGGHGAAQHGPDADEFRAQVADFVERYSMPDGSVYPRRLEVTSEPGHDMHAAASMEHGGHAAPPAVPHGDHGAQAVTTGHGFHGSTATEVHDAHSESLHAEGDAPVDVYLIAEKWFYEPAHLRLDVGVAYRFRMMAADVSHGASIQFGRGGRMVRLRPNRVTEMVATFDEPGSYLVYCTVYCGGAHDAMQARIEVV